jgi:RPA family protein
MLMSESGNQEQQARRPFIREPAKRVFAAEFREIVHQFRDGTDEWSPTYSLLPTGERCNRVCIVGTLTDVQKPEGENQFCRARVADPTGTFFVSAGSYQPEAMHQLEQLTAPLFVSVIGKPNIYNSQDGRHLVSLRAEIIAQVDKDVRDCWLIETAERTLDRLKRPEDGDKIKALSLHPQEPAVWKRMVHTALSSMQI